MKISGIFSLLTNATGLLEFFDGVETEDQMITRLEKLKHGDGPSAILDSIYVTRAAVTDVLDDTIETSSTVDGDDPEFEGSLDDAELEGLMAEEKQIPAEPPASENEKT